MAANKALAFLDGKNKLELRAFEQHRSFLFEMVCCGLRTVCCRVAESSHLVVVDVQGNIRFCIGGAEKKHHTVTAYFSEHHVIGFVEVHTIKHPRSGTGVYIGRSFDTFTIGPTTIICETSKYTLNWADDEAPEMKV